MFLKLAIAGGVALCLSPMMAQTVVAPPAGEAALVRLGGQLMVAGKAYEYDRQLADGIGPRLTGSANYVKATDWAVAEFTRLGLTHVHEEPWKIAATWEPETEATARILSPHEQRLHLESEGWSPSTPSDGVRGNVFYLKALTPEAVKADAANIKGAIVLLDGPSVAAATASCCAGRSSTRCTWWMRRAREGDHLRAGDDEQCI